LAALKDLAAQEESRGGQAVAHSPPQFVHPGMMQNRQDLLFMKQKVSAGEQSWKDAWDNLRRQSYSALTFKPEPFAKVIRGAYGKPNIGGYELQRSADAAYSHALQWMVTSDKAHAQKAIAILNAWSPVLQSFHENDAKLLAGWTGHVFCNAAEILRHTGAGWEPKDIEQFKSMLRTVYCPLLQDFFPEANGNWDAAILHSMMCIGIFCDDRVLFDRAVNHYLRGRGNGGITHYVYPCGQCQESTRDQAHTQLGLGELAQACQVAWTQGVDLYSVADSRLALGIEYTARHLAGESVPFQAGIAPRGRGRFSDIYEGIYQHYHSVVGLDMPYTQRAVEKTRPRSWSALTAYRAPGPGGGVPKSIGPPRPRLTAVQAEATAQAPPDAVLVVPGQSIQKALDAHRGQGGWVVLARGRHTLPAPLQLPSGVTLAGQGVESALWLDGKLTGPAIVNAADSLEDVTLRDFVIEGAANFQLPKDPNADRRRRARPDAPHRAGIQLVAKGTATLRNLRFENVIVRHCTGIGVHIGGASGVVIKACDFSDNGAGATAGPTSHHNLALARVTACEVTDTRLDTSPHGHGLYLLAAKDVTITSCEIARNSQAGVHAADSQKVRIRGNLAEGNGAGGIVLSADKAGCRQIDVRDNLVQNNGGFGIEITRASDGTVHGNNARQNEQAEQIAITGSERIVR